MFPSAIVFLVAALPLCAQTTAPDTNTLPALLPPYDDLPPTFWEQHTASLVVAGLGIVLLSALAAWLVFRPKPKIFIPPEGQARQALEALRRQPEDGAVLSRISQITRQYFIAAFQLAPGEMTTAELNREIVRCHKINPGLVIATADFLRNCDAHKFSPAVPAEPNAAGRALQLIEQAEHCRAQLRQTAAAPTQGRRI